MNVKGARGECKPENRENVEGKAKMLLLWESDYFQPVLNVYFVSYQFNWIIF